MKRLSDKKNIVFGLIFSYVSLGISLLGSFFVTPIVLNNIGDSNYGLLAFCNSITSWLSIISTSLGASFIYFANKEKKERGLESKTNYIFVKMLFILSGIVAITSSLIIFILKISGFSFPNYSTDSDNIIFILLFVSSLNVAITIFFSAFSLYINYKKSFIFGRGIQLIMLVLSYAANVIIALYAHSIVGIALVTLISSLISGVLNLVFALIIKRMIFEKSSFASSRETIKSIIKYSSIILIASIIGNLDSNLDKTLLGLIANSESVTMYQLSISFLTHLVVLSHSFIEVLRPTIYELYRKEKIEEANSLFLKICKMQSVVIFLIIGGYIACGYHFVLLWIGAGRIDVYFYSITLFISNIIPLTKSADSEAFRANNIHKTPMLLSAINISINLILSVTLLFILDVKYAVWACIIGTVAPRIIYAWIVIPLYDAKKVKLPMGKYYKNALIFIAITSIALIPSILLTVFLNSINIPIFVKVLSEGFAFVIVYGVLVALLEKKTLKNIWQVYFKKK